MPTRRGSRNALAAAAVIAMLAAACGRGAIGREYEYEEQIYLELDGSATVVVNASLPALVALRGLDLNPDPAVRFDRAHVRGLYTAPGVAVTRVSPPWRRKGRRFTQVRLQIDDIRQLSTVAPLAWSAVGYATEGDQVRYTQRIGAPAGDPAAGVTWAGDEIVAFRLHLPSRISFHNAPTREVERGNILTYEQSLSERLRGVPIDIEVRMDRQSIFRRTMTIFGLAVGSALVLLAALVWWVRRKGQATAA
jgi:hypothetical protein